MDLDVVIGAACRPLLVPTIPRFRVFVNADPMAPVSPLGGSQCSGIHQALPRQCQHRLSLPYVPCPSLFPHSRRWNLFSYSAQVQKFRLPDFP